MKPRASFLLLMSALIIIPVIAQERERQQPPQKREEHRPPQANGGRIPPPPTRRDARGEREGERMPDGRMNVRPHVNNDRWFGHERLDDRRFHLEHPWAHGRFEHFGPTFRFSVIRVERPARRIFFNDGAFEIASWDWAECTDWCWDCGDDFVIYEDPDHDGWYLIYNIQTGGYVHAEFVGRL